MPCSEVAVPFGPISALALLDRTSHLGHASRSDQCNEMDLVRTGAVATHETPDEPGPMLVVMLAHMPPVQLAT